MLEILEFRFYLHHFFHSHSVLFYFFCCLYWYGLLPVIVVKMIYLPQDWQFMRSAFSNSIAANSHNHLATQNIYTDQLNLDYSQMNILVLPYCFRLRAGVQHLNHLLLYPLWHPHLRMYNLCLKLVRRCPNLYILYSSLNLRFMCLFVRVYFYFYRKS